MKQVLLTGATGFVGRVFAHALLRQYPDIHIWAMVRGTEGVSPAERPEILELVKNPRFHVVAGDLTGPGSGSWSAAFPAELDAVFHFAAQTDFKESQRSQTFQANVEGTSNLLGMLGKLRRVDKLYHVSTAYVCGLRPGEVVREELLGVPQRFANPYEESKYVAESAVAASHLDWTILRLSIVVGDSSTGEAESDKMMYGAFKVYWRLRSVLQNKYNSEQMAALPRGRFAVVGSADIAKNLICVDDAVRLMSEVVRRRPAAGTVFHIVNPRPSSTGEMHDAMCEALDLRCLRADPVSPLKPVAEELLIRRGMQIYEPYTNVHSARFDQSRLRALIGDAVVDAVLPANLERLRFLFGSYLAKKLEAPVQTTNMAVPARLAQVQRHGRGALAYSSLRAGIMALPLKIDGGYVPFALKGRTAAMVGDPVCATTALPAAVDAFLSHCRQHRLSPVAVQVSRLVADLFTRGGGHANRMGDEAEVRLADHDPDVAGGRYAKLRMKRNLAVRHDITVREGTYRDVPYEVVARVSAEWLETKLNKRELDLLLRPLPDCDEPGVRKFFAFRGDELVGFVIFNPMFEHDKVIGYYSDLERYKRRPGGIRHLIVLEALRVFQAEGHELLSLGLAPLLNLDQEDHPTAHPMVSELLLRMRDEVAPVYNFEGVSQQKTYYCPVWKPAYFCSRNGTATTDMLNVFSLIGLLPPEALKAIGESTLDMVHAA